MTKVKKKQVFNFFVNCPRCNYYICTQEDYKDEEIECKRCGLKFIAEFAEEITE